MAFRRLPFPPGAFTDYAAQGAYGPHGTLLPSLNTENALLSSNGRDWTMVNLGYDVAAAGTHWKGAAHNGALNDGRYAVVAEDGVVAVSENGVSWTASDVGWLYDGYSAPATDGVVFMSVSEFAQALVFRNLGDAVVLPMPAGNWVSVVFFNGAFIASALDSNTFARTTDRGATWTTHTFPAHGTNLGGILSTGVVSVSFVDVPRVFVSRQPPGGGAHSAFSYSDDGITFVNGNFSSSRAWSPIATSGRQMFVVNPLGFIEDSTTGASWSSNVLPSGGSGAPFVAPFDRVLLLGLGASSDYTVALDNGFHLVPDRPSEQFVMARGMQRSALPDLGTNTYWSALDVHGDVLFAEGSSDTVPSVLGVSFNAGATWTLAYPPTTDERFGTNVAFDGTTYVVAGQHATNDNVYAYTSTDALTWTPHLVVAASTYSPWTVGFAHGKFVLLLFFGTQPYVSDDGETWGLTPALPSPSQYHGNGGLCADADYAYFCAQPFAGTTSVYRTADWSTFEVFGTGAGTGLGRVFSSFASGLFFATSNGPQIYSYDRAETWPTGLFLQSYQRAFKAPTDALGLTVLTGTESIYVLDELRRYGEPFDRVMYDVRPPLDVGEIDSNVGWAGAWFVQSEDLFLTLLADGRVYEVERSEGAFPEMLTPQQPVTVSRTSLVTFTVPPGMDTLRVSFSAVGNRSDVYADVYMSAGQEPTWTSQDYYTWLDSSTPPEDFEIASPAPGEYQLWVDSYALDELTISLSVTTFWTGFVNCEVV